MPQSSGDSTDVPKISTLVRQKIAAGTSARELERASGGVVAHQQFTSVAKGEIKGWPKSTAAVEAYAKALGVDTRAVVLGFAADLGLDVRESRSLLAVQLPAVARELTPEQVGVIRQLVTWLGQESASRDVLRVPHHGGGRMPAAAREARPDRPPAMFDEPAT